MSAQARLTRILALVPWLVAHEGVTVGECAAHFGVTEEVLQEDLWQLVVCGLPGYGPDQLVDIQFWDDDDAVRRDGVIRVLDPQTLDRPMRLTHQEALALLVALRTLAQLPGLADRDAIVSAAAKLEAASAGPEVEREVHVDVAVAGDVRAAVDAALAGQRVLAITYASATRDQVTERVIEPLRLHSVDGIAYLEAYCRSAGAVRTFRLDRMLSATAGEPFRPTEGRPVDDASKAAADPRPRTATLRLEPAARWIVDVHRGELVSNDPATGIATVQLPLHSVDWGVRLVLSLRGAAVALDPPELVTAVAASAAAALASYP
jgi:proteasome accessory factor C